MRHLKTYKIFELLFNIMFIIYNLRVVDYLGDRYKGCSVLSVGEHERSNINRREITEHNWFGNLSSLIIIYK